jgi:hypothetical protein
MRELSPSPIFEQEKSDTETWFWLMRGDQPATSPVPDSLPEARFRLSSPPAKGGEEINLAIAKSHPAG